MASSPTSQLSQLSSSVMKFKCAEYSVPSGIIVESESVRRRQRAPSPTNDFYYYARGKDPIEEEKETIDSGLSSDTEGFTPPPLPRRSNKKAASIALRPQDMDDSQSDVSADSLALNDDIQTELTSLASSNESNSVSPATARKNKTLPSNLLSEIRSKAGKLHHYQQPKPQTSVKELGKALDGQLKLRKSSSVPPRGRNVILTIPALTQQPPALSFDPDCNQRFHMREYIDIDTNGKISQPDSPIDDLSFAGLKDILNVEKSGQTIRSHKSGTVRGVRNRVRAGITTFLQGKTFKVS